MSFLRASLAVLAVVIAIPAQAAEFRKFDRAAFVAEQASGRPILIDVAAWWCPVCASQNRTIKRTVAAHDYDKLIIFRIDYDGQKPEWKSFGVAKQATLIAFRGRQEVGRIAFRTDKAEIASLLATVVR
jgi:thioredoxin 1